mmetsp:Transcript_1337/g.2733  ORF Transcript_1337/g.2733 Transcript_1337/m.2733 type:complete len:85 (+) Transcript_1337:185-439(+)
MNNTRFRSIKVVAAVLVVIAASLASSVQAGPFCYTGVIAACSTAAIGCVVGSIFNPVISATCMASFANMNTLCQTAMMGCTIVP